MLKPSGDDDELALPYPHRTVPELHIELAGDHEKHLVLVLVAVPDEFPLKLYELHMLAVQLANYLRVEVLGELRKLFGQRDFRRLTPPHITPTG